MPKNFIFFLVVIQAVLSLFHWLIFSLLILFFPNLALHWFGLLSLILALSVSFLAFSVLDYNFDGPVLRMAYLLSSVWLVLAFYFSVASVVALILYIFGVFSLTLAGWLAILTGICFVIYGLVNARITQVISLKIKLPNLPGNWKGRTAVMVSDLHLGHVLRFGFARKIIKLINQQKPDIVFIPGDFYDGVHTDFNALAGEFKKVVAPLGLYFCSGNHELFAGYGQCELAIKNAGIKILENEKVEVEGMQILGLAYKNETDESVAKLLEEINLDKQKPSILLKHVPNHIGPISEAGVNLQLSGHSHHGQIWPFRYITRAVFKGFDYGLKAFGETKVYTSSGVGTWGPPFRVFTKSEIIKIVFE